MTKIVVQSINMEDTASHHRGGPRNQTQKRKIEDEPKNLKMKKPKVESKDEETF